jgi:hypothetical protein
LEFFRCDGDYFSNWEKFEAIEEYISFAGAQIKKLIIGGGARVDQKIVQKLLDFLPNLESLELSHVISANQGQSVKLNVKSTKILQIKIVNCTGLENLLESLEKCAIKELEFFYRSDTDSEAMKKFLKVQEKNLKKLTTATDHANLLNDLKDLRLEYFVCFGRRSASVLMEFLQRQENLKFLKLTGWVFFEEHFEMIWELRNLETLELDGEKNNRYSSNLNNIHKLQKLKRLKIGRGLSENILEHLQFGVFNDLKELDAYFSDASLDSIREMKRIAPKLKKIRICSSSSDAVNALLETLENLESVKIQYGEWEISSEKFYPKVKYFDVPVVNYLNAEQFTKTFPNLATLRIGTCSLDEEPESFLVTLLSELKQLKELCMQIWTDLELDPESVLQCFQQHGKHLEKVYVDFDFKFVIEKSSGVLIQQPHMETEKIAFARFAAQSQLKPIRKDFPLPSNNENSHKFFDGIRKAVRKYIKKY